MIILKRRKRNCRYSYIFTAICKENRARVRCVCRKNELKINEQIELLERMLKRNVEKKYEVQLNKFRRIQFALRPLGAPQERVWNVCYYLNQFGLDFVDRVMENPFLGTENIML